MRACVLDVLLAASLGLRHQMLGATNPMQAAAGTIRGDLCTNAGDLGLDLLSPATPDVARSFRDSSDLIRAVCFDRVYMRDVIWSSCITPVNQILSRLR